ncbi:MAG: radical SAM protein, partial [Desulfurococcaceae archaeon]
MGALGRSAQERREEGLMLYALCPPSGECLQCPFRGRAIVYGPFRSRRRGVSIGINLFPGRKICSFNCIYCFRGVTEFKTLKPVEDAYGISVKTLKQALEQAYSALLTVESKVEALDFSGSGEPTLHARFPEMVQVALEFARERGLSSGVGVFTNSTMLWHEGVVNALSEVEFVEAKLDTVDPEKFVAINQPVEGLRASNVVEWLKRFRKEFSGVLAVQVMLLRYGNLVNYTEKDAENLAEALLLVEPDVVHVYTVYRAPRLSGVLRASEESVVAFTERIRE